jgi:DNA-directed RNA polymerase subunit RPC12/RpoP
MWRISRRPHRFEASDRHRRLMYAAIVDERQFFTEKPEQRSARYQCPRCRRTNDYSLRWVRRTRKTQVPAGADARDRAMFEKVKDHLVRVDDAVVCKSCGKRFDVPSHRNIVFLEELEGLPRDVEEDEEDA